MDDEAREYANPLQTGQMRLAVQGTSVSAERVFSSPVEIVNAKRAVLRSDVVDKLIF